MTNVEYGYVSPHLSVPPSVLMSVSVSLCRVLVSTPDAEKQICRALLPGEANDHCLCALPPEACTAYNGHYNNNNNTLDGGHVCLCLDGGGVEVEC